MNQRSELVSQWQDRLSAAEDLARTTPRLRWFHLARVRLFRFLLACYGSGQWRTAREEMEDSRADDRSKEDEPAEWAGKPPKSVGAIQSVLKSVHNAQNRAPPVGPLVNGLEPEAYLAVTASDARIDAAKCEQFLIERGFHPQVIGRGRRMTVEVPYAELKAAEALIDVHRETLRPVTKLEILSQQQVIPEETQMVWVGLLLAAPVAGMGALVTGSLFLQERLNLGALVGLFLASFIAVAYASLLWYFFGPRLRGAVPLGRRRLISLGVFWASVGIPAALIVAAWVTEYHADPTLSAAFFSPHALIAALASVAAVVITMVLECCVRGGNRPARGRVTDEPLPAGESPAAPDPCSAAAAAGEPSAGK